MYTLIQILFLTRSLINSSQQTAELRTTLAELVARLVRGRQLSYAQRELEMQRLLMGKGASKKLEAPVRVDNKGNKIDVVAERERMLDERDDPRSTLNSKKAKSKQVEGVLLDVKTFKPKVYKWRAERKR